MAELTFNQELDNNIKQLGQLIAEESQKQHPGEVDEFFWDRPTVGKVDLATPVLLADLEKTAPYLVKFLRLGDQFTSQARLSGLGYIHNTVTEVTSVLLEISEPATGRAMVTLQTGLKIKRIFEIGGEKSERELILDGVTEEFIKGVLGETERLLETVISQRAGRVDYSINQEGSETTVE